MVLTAAYLLRLTGSVAFGPAGEPVAAPRPAEAWAVCLLLAASLFLGFFPRFVTEPARPFAADLLSKDAPQAAQAAPTQSPLAPLRFVRDDQREVEVAIHGR